MITSTAEILGSAPAPIVKECRECGVTFAIECGSAYIAKFVNACPKCSEAHAQADQAQMLRKAEHYRALRWQNLCPVEYQNTDPARLPRAEMLKRVLSWRFSHRGLILIGETGRGKSRCAWLLLKREYQAGNRIVAQDHSIGFKYGESFAKSTADASHWIERLCESDILFLDDVFKAKLTDSLEQALFTVVATRCEGRRPTIITSNDTGESLLGRLSPDRGAALVRRLREYSEVISFG